MSYKVVTKEEVITAHNAAVEANRIADRLQDKINFQTFELPRLVEKAKRWLEGGYGDNYTQSQLYASRNNNVGIDEIVYAIQLAKEQMKIVIA